MTEATAQSEINNSTLTITGGESEPLGVITSTGSVATVESSSGVISSGGQENHELTQTSSSENSDSTQLNDNNQSESTQEDEGVVTKENLIEFIESHQAINVGSDEFAELFLKHFQMTKIEPPTLHPGKFPGIFALITEAVVVDDLSDEGYIHLDAIKHAFEEHNLNTNTKAELEACGLDYDQLLKDLA